MTSAPEPPAAIVLDQYPAAWLASELQARPAWPAARADIVKDTTRTLGRTPPKWRRWLPYAFLPLTLFGFAGIAGAIIQMLDEGSVDWNDALTLVFGAFVTLALYAQLRSLVLLTPLARRFRTRTKPVGPAPVFFNQQADAIAVDVALQRRRSTALLRSSVRRAQRVLPLVVAVLGAAGLVALFALLVIYAGDASIFDLGFLMSAVFGVVGVYGYSQFLRTLGRAGWRGSPSSLLKRAFYDSSRLYSGAHSLVQVGVSGAATAIVVTAGLAPIAFPSTPPFVLMGSDARTGHIVTVKPEDGTLRVSPTAANQLSISSLATVRRDMRLPDGRVVRKSDVLTIVSGPQAQVLTDLSLRAGEVKPVVRLRSRLDVAGLGVKLDGTVLILERSGNLSTLNLASGETRILGNTGWQVSTASLDSRNGRFIALSGTEILSVSTADGSFSSLGQVTLPAAIDACGISRLGNHVVIADRNTSSLLVFDRSGSAIGTIGPSPLDAPVCGIVALPRPTAPTPP